MADISYFAISARPFEPVYDFWLPAPAHSPLHKVGHPVIIWRAAATFRCRHREAVTLLIVLSRISSRFAAFGVTAWFTMRRACYLNIRRRSPPAILAQRLTNSTALALIDWCLSYAELIEIYFVIYDAEAESLLCSRISTEARRWSTYVAWYLAPFIYDDIDYAEVYYYALSNARVSPSATFRYYRSGKPWSIYIFNILLIFYLQPCWLFHHTSLASRTARQGSVPN